jgi:hypothetical protein
MRVHFLPAALVAALAACGSDLDPGSGDDPGTGSQTLFVDADVEASPVVTNASSATGFQTSFAVRVRKNNVDVTQGVVTITSNGGATTLIFDAAEARWRGTQASYHEVYVLSVDGGEDHVDGVRVDGPALHHFTEPLPGAVVNATLPLMVRWAREEAAATTSFDTEEINELEIADTGSYAVPTGGLKSNGNEPTEERLRLDRSSRVSPAGAIAGSSVRVRVRNEIDVLVAATGL